jgi:hypothetical protein
MVRRLNAVVSNPSAPSLKGAKAPDAGPGANPTKLEDSNTLISKAENGKTAP